MNSSYFFLGICLLLTTKLFAQTSSDYEPYTLPPSNEITWSLKVLRTIDLREEDNQKLFFPVEPTNERMSLIDVIMQAVQSKKLKVYAVNEKKIMELGAELSGQMSVFGELDSTIYLTDNPSLYDLNAPNVFYRKADHRGSGYVVVYDTKLPTYEVKRYMILEQWYLTDKNPSIDVRILAICPVRERYDKWDKKYISQKLFWIKYDEARPVLAAKEVFNPRNVGDRMTFDKFFISRRFTSYIDVIENIYDNRSLFSYEKDSLSFILEGARINANILMLGNKRDYMSATNTIQFFDVFRFGPRAPDILKASDQISQGRSRMSSYQEITVLHSLCAQSCFDPELVSAATILKTGLQGISGYSGKSINIKFAEILKKPTSNSIVITTASELLKNEKYIDKLTVGDTIGLNSNTISKELKRLSWYPDGFLIKNIGTTILIIGESEKGAMYGAYHLVQNMIASSNTQLNTSFVQTTQLRLASIWESGSFKLELPNEDMFDNNVVRNTGTQFDFLEEEFRYEIYAIMLASFYINGVVMNDYDAELLKPQTLERLRVFADVLRKYGIKIYFAVNIKSPEVFGFLNTSDIKDNRVKLWWREKIEEIMTVIPNFGGFVIHAFDPYKQGAKYSQNDRAEFANELADYLTQQNSLTAKPLSEPPTVIWRSYSKTAPIYFNKNVQIQTLNPKYFHKVDENDKDNLERFLFQNSTALNPRFANEYIFLWEGKYNGKDTQYNLMIYFETEDAINYLGAIKAK